MNDHFEDGSSSVRAPLTLPLEFEAHYITNQEAYHQYALVHLKTEEAAEEAVHRAFLEILRHWNELLAESNLQQQTWAIMRRVVISQALLDAQARLINSDHPVHEALAKLPPKQFDAVVLRGWLDKNTEDIAWYMGVTTSTVDYHCRKARERLAQALNRTSRTKKAGRTTRKTRNQGE
ncbi:sigma-70 family RNA polymerase sigma factor [Streptomyces sp. NPDC005271]|uniref:RNA polymerase sigma factor n=1 Tax=unclassified Streptomyces TaxID=2593676 RepID=UPI0033AB1793